MKELFQVILTVVKLMLFPFAFVLLLVLAKIKVDLVYNVYIRNVVKAFEANGGLKGLPVLAVVYYINELLNSESMLQVVRMSASKTITPYTATTGLSALRAKRVTVSSSLSGSDGNTVLGYQSLRPGFSGLGNLFSGSFKFYNISLPTYIS